MNRVTSILLVITLLGWGTGFAFDLGLQGGPVTDPESGLDAIRDMGISQGKVRSLWKNGGMKNRESFCSMARRGEGR